MDDLTEAVARALCKARGLNPDAIGAAWGGCPQWQSVPIRRDAYAAIAVVLEEAAKCADDNRTDDDSMWDRAAQTIATAIRAMGERVG